MRIVVTNNSIEYKGFLKLKTLEEAYKTTGSIEVLVYHKSNEKENAKVDYLTKLKDRVSTLIYIRNKEYYEQAVQLVVVGSGGSYIEDEFFLESGEELNSAISNLSQVTSLVELGGVDVMSGFFNQYLSKEDTGINKAYLTMVKNACTSIIDDYKKKGIELIQLSETATDLFSNYQEMLSSFDEEREKLKGLISNLKEAKEENALAFASSPMSSISYFAQISYPKEKNILRIKEYGNCAYLTSFILGYKLHLERIKYVRPKVIFIYPTGEQYETKYKNYSWVTKNNCKTMEVYYNSVVFTNYPTKEVVSRLLDDSSYDTFIVVDRLKQNKCILNSKGSIRYAVSGKSDLSAFDIKNSLCFSCSNVVGAMFWIKPMLNFPVESDQRERLYLRDYGNAYDLLYSLKTK